MCGRFQITLMDDGELSAFAERVYYAGPNDQMAQRELMVFAVSANAMQTIVSAIDRGSLSRIGVLVCLSIIPRTSPCHNMSMTELRTWFRKFVRSRADILIEDYEMRAKLELLFVFCFECDQEDGRKVIQSLVDKSQVHCIMGVHISRRLAEGGAWKNTISLVPIGLKALQLQNSSAVLVDAGLRLLLAILERKEDMHQHRRAVFAVVCEEFGIHKLASLIYRHKELVAEHALTVMTNIVAFPVAVFGGVVARSECLREVTKEVVTLVRKGAVPMNAFQTLAKLAIELRKAQDPEDEVSAAFVMVIGRLTEALLEPVELERDILPAECILRFWIGVTRSQEVCFVTRLLEIFHGRFFSRESIGNVVVIERIMSDESSVFIDEMVKVASSASVAYAEAVAESLEVFAGMGAKSNSSFCLEYLATAIKSQESVHNAVPVIMRAIATVVSIFPRLHGSSEADNASILFEVSLVHAFRVISVRYLVRHNDSCRQFGEQFGELIRGLFVRFLSEIQSKDAPFRLTQAVMKSLEFSEMSRTYLALLASDSSIYDLISTSKAVWTSVKEDSEETQRFFGSLFMFGYAFQDSSKILHLTRIVSNLIGDTAPHLVFAMISGAFIPPNCRFDFIWNSVKELFIPRCLSLLSSGRKDVLKPMLEFILATTSASVLQNLQPMCPPIVDYVISVADLLSRILLVRSLIDKKDVLSFEILERAIRILTALMKLKTVNFGILQLYGKVSIREHTLSLLDALLMIGFDSFGTRVSLTEPYLCFVATLAVEDPDLFFGLPEPTINHQIHLLTCLLNSGASDLRNNSAQTLLIVTTNLTRGPPPSLAAVLPVVFKLVVGCGVKDTSIIRLLSALSRLFSNDLDGLRDAVCSNFSPCSESRAHILVADLLEKLSLDESSAADHAIKCAVADIIYFARECQTTLCL